MLATAVLAHITKLKRDLGLAFRTNFLHDFAIKISLFDTLIIDKISMPHPNFFWRYQTKCTVDGDKIFLGSTAIAMVDREKKKERQKNKNLKISRTNQTFKFLLN